MNNLLRIIIIYFSLNIHGFCNDLIPINIDNDLNYYLKRQVLLSDLPLEVLSGNHILNNNIFFLINDSNKIPQSIAREFLASSNKQKMNTLYDNFKSYDLNAAKSHILKISNDSLKLWVNWTEKASIITNKNSHKGYFVDEVIINSIINENIFIYSSFSMNRMQGDIINLNSYNKEWSEYYPDYNYNIWYNSASSIYIKSKIFDIEISNTPYRGGWSNDNSVLISNQGLPFHRFSVFKKSGPFKFEYFHGQLNPSLIDSMHIRNSKESKYISSHKLNYNFNKKLSITLGEYVIYGNRPAEFTYLNPLSFFWAEEHNLGDLDNILMSFDIAYKPVSGLLIYQTLIWDELVWNELFADSWRNKYAYQIGLFYATESINIPDIILEYTMSRPWMYTHYQFPFSHNNKSLGFKHGPNSRSFSLQSNWRLNNRANLNMKFEKLTKGSAFGSNISDNYDKRDTNLDLKSKNLMGEKKRSLNYTLLLKYKLTNLVNFEIELNDDIMIEEYIRFGLELNL